MSIARLQPRKDGPKVKPVMKRVLYSPSRRLAKSLVAAAISVLAVGASSAQEAPAPQATGDSENVPETLDETAESEPPGDSADEAPGSRTNPETDGTAEQPAPQVDQQPDVDGESLIRQKMRVFRAYEGEWEGVQAYAEAEGNAAFESKGEWKGRFLLDGMYFAMDGYSEYPTGRSSYRWMITYDVLLEKYRAWTFNSNGVVTDWMAHHDPDHKELVWRFVDPRTGIRGWLRTQTQPNLVTGHGMAKTEGARVLSDYRLKFTRKKLRI